MLPDKFSFVSHINETMRGAIYHAVKTENKYDITLPGEAFVWHSTITDMRKKVLSGEYEVVCEYQ